METRIRRRKNQYEIYDPATGVALKTVATYGEAEVALKADYGADAEGMPTYTPGDHILLIGDQGEPTLYHINAIDGNNATLEQVDSDLAPTGQTLSRALSDATGLGLSPEHFAALQPLYVINEGGADDYSVKAATLGADTPDSAFAYVPKGGNPSDRKLPLTKNDGKTWDAGHIKLAWQAITKGMMGKVAKIPSDALDAVKSRIKSAANKLTDGAAKKAVLAYINGGDSSSKSIKSAAPARVVREQNIAVKSIGDDGWRIGGYALLYGSPSQTDLDGEWFSKSTDFKADWYNIRPLLFEHTQDGVIKRDNVGIVDTIEFDEYGAWYEAQLDRSKKYAAKLKSLVQKNVLGSSTGTLAHVMDRNKTNRKEITIWPIAEVSLTTTPAEPRTIGVSMKHYIEAAVLDTAYKSIGKLADKWLDDDSDTQDGSTDTRQQSASATNADGEASPSTKSEADNASTSQTQEVDMPQEFTPEQIAQIAAIVAQAQKVTEAAPVQAAATPAAPTKSLPASGAVPTPPSPDTSTKSAATPAQQVSVIGDRRFAHLNAEDMSILTDLYGGVMDRLQMKRMVNTRGYEPRPLEAAAVKFYEELNNDPDNKLARLICDKTLRLVAENRMDSEILQFLPFSSKAAIEGNYLDQSAVKYAQAERFATKMADQGKSNEEIRQALKSLDFIKSNELDNTGQSNFGAEWVPTIWNNQAWRRIRINNVMAAMMFAVQMPSNPWNWPIESTDPTVYYIAEGTDATQLVLGSGNTLALSKAGTGKVAFTAKKLGAHIGFSTEENEDSIIPIIPIWKYQTMRALANYVDDTLINGDTATGANTNINLIDGTPAAGTSYLAMDGFRKYGLVTNTGQLVDFGNVAPTLANFRAMQTKLKPEYQADFQNLMYVINVGTWQKMKAMPEFSSYMNSGVPPTQITGLLPNGSANQVGSETTPMPVGYIDGIPVYVSAQIGLAKSGAIGSNGGEISTTVGNNITGTAILYHRSRAVLGWRRAIGVDVLATSIFSDTFQIWGTTRFALNFFDTQSVVIGYDIAN